MILWLKFDSKRIQTDSSITYDLVMKGAPDQMPNDMGKYNNWGAFFDFGDMLCVLKDGMPLGQ
jgi:hypothetical protein